MLFPAHFRVQLIPVERRMGEHSDILRRAGLGFGKQVAGSYNLFGVGFLDFYHDSIDRSLVPCELMWSPRRDVNARLLEVDEWAEEFEVRGKLGLASGISGHKNILEGYRTACIHPVRRVR